VRLATLYVIRLHLPATLGAWGLLTLLVLAGAVLPVAEHLLALSLEEPLGVLGALATRSLLEALPFAALTSTLAVGLGLRARGERVALALCGVRRRDRLAVALAFGLAASLGTAEAGRRLVPSMRQVERQVRGASASLGTAVGLLDRLESVRGLADLSVYVERVAGHRLEGVVVWRAPGLPDGQVVRAAAGWLRPGAEEGRFRLELEGAELLTVGAPVLGPFRVVAIDRLTFTLRVDDLDGGPRVGEAPADLLWSARAAGALWRTDRIDRELSGRAAEALLALAMALAGFGLAERAAVERGATAGVWGGLGAWAGALGVAAIAVVAEPIGRSLGRAGAVAGVLAPWLGTVLVAGVGGAALLGARAEDE